MLNALSCYFPLLKDEHLLFFFFCGKKDVFGLLKIYKVRDMKLRLKTFLCN